MSLTDRKAVELVELRFQSRKAVVRPITLPRLVAFPGWWYLFRNDEIHTTGKQCHDDSWA